MDSEKKILQEKFDLLPEELKNAITSVEVGGRITKKKKKYSLRIDQSGILDEEIIRVMVGITHPDLFLNKLKGRLGINTKTVEDIVRDLNTEVFLPVRKSLMELHEKADERETPEEHPSKEEILHEIENPTQNEAPKKPSTELMVGRLTGIVQIPGGKSQIPVKKPVPPTPPSQPLQKTVSQSPNDQRPRSSDPYREPIN